MSSLLSTQNPLLPHLATVTKIINETPSVNTYQVAFDNPTLQDNFGNKPGQCAMLSVLGEGEAMISITSSPTRKGILEFSIRKVGRLTSAIHELDVGSKITLRGPYGNHFPYDQIKKKNCIFIAGGIGLAPLRSLIDYVLDNRDDYGRVDIVYGSRSYDELCFKYDLFDRWPKIRDTNVYVTIDREEKNWNGHVGFVGPYFEELNLPTENTVAVTCGPPIVIKGILQTLNNMDFNDEDVITTLEMKMKCGIGKCGRCNVGNKYICIDGPVFNNAQLKKLPPEW